MPVYNEDPATAIFRYYRWPTRSPDGAAFDIALLSDSIDPKIYQEEARRFEAWRSQHPSPHRLFYRLRLDNQGKKTTLGPAPLGNHDYLLVLDADSLTSASWSAEWHDLTET